LIGLSDWSVILRHLSLINMCDNVLRVLMNTYHWTQDDYDIYRWKLRSWLWTGTNLFRWLFIFLYKWTKCGFDQKILGGIKHGTEVYEPICFGLYSISSKQLSISDWSMILRHLALINMCDNVLRVLMNTCCVFVIISR
jgi:hypothetical protein